MPYTSDPYDTPEPPCFCDLDDGPVLTTEEFCPAHGDSDKFPPEPDGDEEDEMAAFARWQRGGDD